MNKYYLMVFKRSGDITKLYGNRFVVYPYIDFLHAILNHPNYHYIISTRRQSGGIIIGDDIDFMAAKISGIKYDWIALDNSQHREWISKNLLSMKSTPKMYDENADEDFSDELFDNMDTSHYVKNPDYIKIFTKICSYILVKYDGRITVSN